MNKSIIKSLPVMLAAVLIVTALSCAAPPPSNQVKTVAAQSVKRVVPVQKGDLVVSVSVDGNLNMPQAFDLHFGAPGDVKEVLVKEGDRVKAGAILARLDDTIQRLDVKASNNSVQMVLSNLYETVPRLPQFPTTFYDSDKTVTNNYGIPVTSSTTDIFPTTTVVSTSDYTWWPTSPDPPPMPGTTTETVALAPYTGTPVTSVSVVTTGNTVSTITSTTTPTTNQVNTVVKTIDVKDGPVVSTPTGDLNTKIVTTTITTTINTTRTLTTSATTDTTTTTTTILKRPTFGYSWNDTTNEWEFDPNATLFYGSPNYYANSTAMSSFLWAVDSINAASWLTMADNLTSAASELYVAAADLEATAIILEDAINNPDSGLGNMAPHVPDDAPGLVSLEVMMGDAPASITLILELRKAVEAVRQSQADIEKLRDLLKQGKKDVAAPLFEPLIARMAGASKIVFSNVNIIEKRSDTDVYGKEVTVRLYAAAEEKLSAALRGVEKGGLQSDGLNDNLRIARHYMELANGIVGSNDYVLQHGLSLKAENQYKVDLENKLIDLDNKKEDFLKTVIMAPVDGVVVNVAVKVNDVLSQQDYSAKGTIQLVDTSQIKFLGQVDEIDILKIKTGQKASVTIDAVPDRAFPGKVSFISPFGTADASGVVKFNVTVLLDPTDVDLKGGLTATADIGVSRTENALTVPLAAVTTSKDGSFVNVEIDSATGKTEKRPVKLGAQNQQMAQIIEGLSEGEKVVVEIKAVDISVRTTPGPPPGTGGGGPPR